MKSDQRESKMHLKEATKYLGISHRKMSQLVKERTLEFWIDPLDKRRRLVSIKDLDRLKQLSLKK